MDTDADRWDARYAGLHTGEPRPPKGLDGIELPPAGLCVDVACGLGAQTVWAARLGFRVLAIDVSSTAIKAVVDAAAAHDVAGSVEARVVDLDGGLPVDVAGRCSLVICQRFRGAGLYPQLVDAARPGGVIVVTVLSQVGAAGEPGPFHAPLGELSDAFRALDVDILRSIESDGEATLVARRHSTNTTSKRSKTVAMSGENGKPTAARERRKKSS